MHAYCLFCETKRCHDIAFIIERDLGYRCFVPIIIQRKWVKGVAQEVRHDWLPGYVFLYTNEPVHPRFAVKGIIRCLGNDELEGNDLAFAEMLYARDGILGTVKLAEVGDRCKLIDPLWASISGTLIKVDRGRKRCCVEYEFDGVKRQVWAGYDMVEAEKEEAKE